MTWAELMPPNLACSDAGTAAPPTRQLRLSIGHWMSAVAGVAVVFGSFGVNAGVSMVIVAFLFSMLIIKPGIWQDWLLMSIGAVFTLPFMPMSYLFILACRVAFFPDDPRAKSLDFMVPTIVSIGVTCLFFRLVMRFATWPRRVEFAVLMVFLLWGLALFILSGN